MLTAIHPKLPMRNKALTRAYYVDKLGFRESGSADYDGYLMGQKDSLQLHFFIFKALNPKENYGQVYSEPMELMHCTSPCRTTR